MLKKFYYWFHRKISKPDERGEYSSGYWEGAIRREVLALCRGQTGKFLDVGCGEGLFLAELALTSKDVRIYGIDNWQEILQKAGKRLKAKGVEDVILSVADAASLPYSDDYFDTVVCMNVIFNLGSGDVVKKVLGEMARVCKPGGRIIFDIRNSRNPLLYFKYKLAKYYDATVKNLPLKTYSFDKVVTYLKECDLEVTQKIAIGFPKNSLAPIFVIQAREKQQS